MRHKVSLLNYMFQGYAFERRLDKSVRDVEKLKYNCM